MTPIVVAKAAQYLTSGLASHIHVALFLDVVSRKVLKQGTAHPRLCAKSRANGFRWMYFGQPEAGVGLWTTRTLRDTTAGMQEVEHQE